MVLPSPLTKDTRKAVVVKEVNVMATNKIKQQEKRIDKCCYKIESTNSPEEISHQVKEIQGCCNNIEQQIKV